MSLFQLDLFQKDDESFLRYEIQQIEKTCENVRKGIFARHNELCKKYLELKEENEMIKFRMHKLESFFQRYGEPSIEQS
jgi:hypothetical protein